MSAHYKLPQEEHEIILKKLQEKTFRGAETSGNPTLYVLGGQPGAGKSQLIELSRKDSPGAVTINGDEYRKYHPQADEIFRKHDKDFAKMTDPDVREWTREVFDEAKARCYDIIFEGTMRTEQICETMKDFKAEGYQVVVRVVAAHELESRTAIYGRYEQQLQTFGTARFTDRASHDAAYTGMLKTLDRIEKEGLADKLEAYNRDGHCVFSSSREAPRQGVGQAVMEERTRRGKSDAMKDCATSLDRILRSMESRGEALEYVEDVRGLLAEAVTSKSRDLETIRGRLELASMETAAKFSGEPPL